MTTTEAREAIAERIRVAFGDGYTVYEAGDDLVKTPCIVINPGNPYLAPTTMGQDAAVQMALNFYLVVNRMSPKDSLKLLEDMRLTCTQAIKSGAPAGRWASFRDLGPFEIGDVQYASGMIDALFVVSDN